MNFFILCGFVYSSLIKVLNNIRDQLVDKLQENLLSGNYACLNLDDHYIIHFIKLDRSKVMIERYDKVLGVTKSESINIFEHLDENLNFSDTIKQVIIQKLYSFEDTKLKYMCIVESDDIHKNEMFIFDFLRNLSSCVNMIENYDIKKSTYLDYKSILRNSYLFEHYTHDKTYADVVYTCQDYNMNLFDLVLLGNKSEMYFFEFYNNMFDISEYFRIYYNIIKGVNEEDIEVLLRFVENFNYELCEINLDFEIIETASTNFMREIISMDSENVPLTRKYDLEINEHQMIFNGICYSPTKAKECDKNIEYFTISNYQMKEINKFNKEITGLNFEDIIKRNKLISLLKGSEVYNLILENLLINQDSGKQILLINILFSLAIITKSQFEELLYNRCAINLNLNYISNQINCHYASVRFSLYNILLYSELDYISNGPNEIISFFCDFNQIIELSSVEKLMNLSNINHLTVLDKLDLFIDRVFYNPEYVPLTINLEHSTSITSLICKYLSKRLIVDENLSLLNIKDRFEEDYIPLILDQINKKNIN